MNKSTRCAALILAAVAVSTLPAFAAEPSFSCGDATKVGRALYDRTKEAHDKRFRAHAEFLAESFWRVAETFNACDDLKKLGGKLGDLYPPTTRGRFAPDGSSFGMITISGMVDKTKFTDMTVEVAAMGGTAVVEGRIVPGTMLVDGIPFVPTATTTAAARSMKDEVRAMKRK